jgi:hypothetical protein
MDEDTLWNDIANEVRKLAPTGRPDEFWIEPKYGRKQKSRIRIYWNELTRITPQEKEQPIPKSEIMRIAMSAIDSPTGKFCIKGYKAEGGGWYGSIVCAILDRLPYFSYEKGQMLVYHRSK